jgi:hypothetical protein
LCNSPFVAVWTGGKMGVPATLSEGDITNLVSFAAKLKQPSPSDGVSQYLSTALSPATRKLLSNYAGGRDSPLQQALVDDLNQVIQAGPVYDAQRFAGAKLSPQTLSLLAQNPQGEDLIRLNRMLLLDAYPLELTKSRASWSPVNDVLLAIWLVICVSLHAHIGLVGQTKQFRFLRYLYFFEGLVFVGLAILLHRFGGVTMMLLISVVCSLSFSFPYGLRRTREYFKLTWSELAGWHRAPLALALWLVPVAVVPWWLTRALPPVLKLVLCGAVVGLWAGWVLLRHGLDAPLQAQVLQRAPAWLRPALVRAGCSGQPRGGGLFRCRRAAQGK